MKAWLRLPPALVLTLFCLQSAATEHEPQLLRLDRVDGYLELGVRGRDDSNDRPGSGTSFSKSEWKLDEILNLNLAGSVYYPRLLRYDAGIDIHFLQNLTSGKNQTLPGGHLSLDFLEKKPYGLNLFGRISQDQVEGTFGSNLDTRTESYGGSIRYDLGPLPFKAGYAHRFYTRETDLTTNFDEEVDEVTFLGHYQIGPSSDGNIRYLFADEVLRGQPNQRHELVADNITYFGPGQRKRFSGGIRYFDLSARSDTSSTALISSYDWRHTDTLTSFYHFDYSHRSYDGETSNIYNLGAAVDHQLYGSLRSHGGIAVSLQDASASQINEYRLEIAERYTKRLGSWGRLGISLAPRIGLAQQKPDARTGFILDETATFDAFDRLELRQPNVDASSIVVTSTNGATLYQEGLDYLIVPVGDLTELERIPLALGGSIPPGDTVLVDYQFEFENSDNDILQYGIDSDLDISYRDWGSFFVKIETKREDLVGGFTARRLNNRDRQEFGFRSRGRWYSALVSFDWEDTDIRSANGNLQTLTLSTPWRRIWTAGLGATHRGRSFSNPREELREWRINARFDTRIGRGTRFELDPEYSSQKWTGAAQPDGRNFDAVGGTARLVWNHRSLEVRAEAAGFLIKRTDGTRVNDRFLLRVRRYF